MKKKINVILIVIGLLAIIVASFEIGLFMGKKSVPKNNLGQTFYANITDIIPYDDSSFVILVKGLEINDMYYSGRFKFKVTDDIDMTWRGRKIDVSDLKEGDIVSITFTDEQILAVSPSPLSKVVRVQLIKNTDEEEQLRINGKVTSIDIETSGYNLNEPFKKYTLNQEEMYTIFNIMDNLTFSNETCDGLDKYVIKYNNAEKNGFITYGIETYRDKYHITSSEKGEAVLSNEQKVQLEAIIKRMY